MSRITSQSLALLVGLLVALSLLPLGPAPAVTALAHQPAEAPVFASLSVSRSPAIAAAPDESLPARAPDRAPALVSSPMQRPQEAVRNSLVNAAPFAERTPAMIPGSGPWMRGTRVAQTERLDLYVGLRTFTPEQIATAAPRLEQLLRENERRIGTVLDSRVSIAFYRPALAPDRDTRGIAYTEHGRAEVYYRPDEDLDRAMIIATHELAHHLQAQRYGSRTQQRADIILLEGMATWITGDIWLSRSGAPSWKMRARQIEAAGVPLRLLDAHRYGSDNAYELWASFVDFLVERYGWEKLDALYRSGRGRAAGSADYAGTLGCNLGIVADEWRAWIREG